eukprot:731231-Heterocapsa_arctica.AAC.1
MNKERMELTCIDSVKAEAGIINNNKRRTEEDDKKEMGKAKNNKIEHDCEALIDNSQVQISKGAKFLQFLQDKANKGNNKKRPIKGK